MNALTVKNVMGKKVVMCIGGHPRHPPYIGIPEMTCLILSRLLIYITPEFIYGYSKVR